MSIKKFFKRFLISYIIVLLIPILIGFISYSISFKVVEQSAINSNMAMLEQSKEIMDQRYKEIKEIIHQILSNNKIKRFCYVTDPYFNTNILNIIDVKKDLYDYPSNNEFISRYYIFFNKSRLVLGYNFTYTVDDFFKNFIIYSDMPNQAWEETLFQKYHHLSVLPDQTMQLKNNIIHIDEHRWVTFLHSIGYLNEPLATIAIFVDNKEFATLFHAFDFEKGGYAYITDENGKTITGFPSSDLSIDSLDIHWNGGSGYQVVESNREKMLVTYTHSNINGWRYISVLPLKAVMEKLGEIKRITIIIVLASFIIGISIAYFLTKRNIKPVDRLIHDREIIQLRIDDQKPFLTAAYLERLFKGGFDSNDEIKSRFLDIGFNITGDKYQVIILKFSYGENPIYTQSSPQILESEKINIITKLQKICSIKSCFHIVDHDKIGILLISNLPEERHGKSLITEFVAVSKTLLEEQYRCYCTFSIGRIYSQLMDISRSYEEAKSALNYQINRQQHEVIWYSRISNQINGYQYPAEIETRIINCIKRGESEALEQILKEVYMENFIKRKLSTRMIDIFIKNIWGTIIKILELYNIEDEVILSQINKSFNTLHDKENVDDIQKSFDILHQLCESFAQRKKDSNQELISNILSYIDKTYTDENLSLALVADKFHTSEAYLSQFFKERTGLNFSEYIQQLRMQKARDLLLGTELPIKEIVSQVGYTSYNTFARAFKRIFGVNATSYRDLNLKVK